ncbi:MULTISPECIES: serine/threonine-protein kinase [unclassified Frankia]|uniref:serine/threonine-protein kinase n=1 Tax=unclassified Frankia TaxID=2632575 RepID=UPI002AD2E965|nr:MULTISPECIES: serine/threonine-protein kinase [unclassified Frankia]
MGTVRLQPPGAVTTPGADRRVIGGRYRLDSPIGRGGAGVVWCGEDELLQRPVAVKEIILVPFAGTQQDREAIRSRVLREARALARLHSSAIVTVFDVVEEAHRHWIVMELVDADSLGDVIRTDGPLPPARVAAIGLALTEALGAAHAAGVLHRDIKPGNILLAGDGRVRLTDFGIAAIEGDTTLTATGTLMGSPGYIAPERVRGSSGSPASDLWGLAATLYAAVEGHPRSRVPKPTRCWRPLWRGGDGRSSWRARWSRCWGRCWTGRRRTGRRWWRSGAGCARSRARRRQSRSL